MVLSIELIILLLVVLVTLAFAWLYHAQMLAGKLPERRAIPAFDVMRAALSRGAETGYPIHISPGAGTIGERATTAETLVGLIAAERVAAEAALKGAPVIASSGDAIAHAALRGTIRQAYRRAGRLQDYQPEHVQLLAHNHALAYATGVATMQTRQPLEASQLLGSFGQEYLLIGEDNNQRAIPTLAGSVSPEALPLMLLTTPHTLIGEEVFAAEAYLSNAATPQARLMTHDVLRTVTLILLLLGFVYAQVQPLLGLPQLFGGA